jgi:hypothetical protein
MILIALLLFIVITIIIYYNKTEHYENKKKCLLIFYGLPRTFEKTSENIYKNLIKPNDNYNFTIIINTSSVEHTTIDKLNNIYKCKTILLEDYEKQNNPPHARLLSPLQQETVNKYDMYVYSRMDVVLNKEVYLDDYTNSLCIIEGPDIRSDIFHHRDWDYMWIGSEAPFKIWCYYLVKYLGKQIEDDSFVYNDVFAGLDYIRFQEIKNKIKLIDDSNQIHFCHNILNEILANGYNVELSTNKGVYATIVR